MAERKECEICREMQKRKHKYDIVWKIVAIVSTILAIVFICLYACSGTIVKETEINNNVEVSNEGKDIYNNNIGTVSAVDNSKEDNSQALIICMIFAILVAVGIGGTYVGYVISQGRHKQQREGSEQDEKTRKEENNN